MTLELRHHRKIITDAPRMQVLALFAITTVTLDPKITNLGNLLGGLIVTRKSSITTAAAAAVGSAPSVGVIGPGGAWAGERRGGRRVVIGESTAAAAALGGAVGWRR